MRRFGLVALVVVGVVLILFYEDIGKRLGTNIKTSDRPVLATLEQTKGRVQIKRAERVEFELAKEGDTLSSSDLLQVDADSTALLKFNSELVLRAKPETQLVLERDEFGPILVAVLSGGTELLKAGRSGEVLISKDGLVRDPVGRDLPAPSGGSAAVLKEVEKAPVKKVVEEKAIPGTLSDDYISSVVRSQRSYLRDRCYAQLLKSKPEMLKNASTAAGRIFTSFIIQPNGEVGQLKILKSSIADKEFEKCIVSVLERARFKAFNGDPIVVNYPILFE